MTERNRQVTDESVITLTEYFGLIITICQMVTRDPLVTHVLRKRGKYHLKTFDVINYVFDNVLKS